MKRHQFKITLDASREKVWDTLWGDATYPEWTSVFAEGSRAETDWKKGSKVLFLDGNGQGMVSTIADLIPNEFMSFKHLGEVKDGKEDLNAANEKGWAGAVENYTLKSVGGKTELVVDIDIEKSYEEYFLNAFPKALEKLKALTEEKTLVGEGTH
jgi:hypothetical protein